MVNLSSCPVFSFLLLIGIIFFYTSKVALDNHLFREEIFVNEGQSVHKDRSWHLNRITKPLQPDITPSLHFTTSVIPSVITDSKEVQTEVMKQTVKGTCDLNFPPSCSISKNLIRYWEENTTDCFQSPLRRTSGLQADIRDRRYLVFQPDLGGWNNIRMALEVAILFAHFTGRILVMPPSAILYLLHMNKKWGENKASMADYLDFDRMRAGNGLEIITMGEFLTSVASPGLLSKPLPENNTGLIKTPLWDYLESACYVRQWSPGKTFIAFNISSADSKSSNSMGVQIKGDMEAEEHSVFGQFSGVSRARLNHITLDMQRQLLPYDKEFHSQRAVYFPGHDKNRLLTLWYGYFFFAEPAVERRVKRYMRDRVRYLDVVFCAAGRIVDLLIGEIDKWEGRGRGNNQHGSGSGVQSSSEESIGSKGTENVNVVELPLVSYKEERDTLETARVYQLMIMNSSYIAYHIRRGDFQQKHTRLEAGDILNRTRQL